MRPFRSIRVKLLAVVALTTFCALLVSGVIIFFYEINTFRSSRLNEMSAQIDLLSYSTAPALQFLDANMARENLDLLRIQPVVRMAAIYDANGTLFASYVRQGADFEVPPRPAPEGVTIRGNTMEVFRSIVLDNSVVGTAFIHSDYALQERGMNLFKIQAAVTLGAMLAAIALSVWLQSIITKPVLSIAEIARGVVVRKDFHKRAEKISDDEVGILVDAFNDMLHEIDTRTTVLETTNTELEHEINERKRARVEVLWLNGQLERRIQELHEKDRNKDDFLATLAHELRNPLAPIRTGLEVIRTVDDATREKIYAILERQSNHLIRLVDDLMDLSRISRGKVALKKQTVLLEDILQVAIEATTEAMKLKKHTLEVSLPERPVYLHGDPVRLTQIFLNLLANAAVYTNEGGAISLTASCHEGLLEVAIADNGIGMDPEMVEKVFEAFIQLENPLGRSRGGLGIGLTLARALIRRHEGTIRAESEGRGKGSRFIVTLPVLADPSLPTEPTDSGREDSTPRRILVVDDNEDAALTLSMQMRMAGHDLKVAYSGGVALEIGRDFLPDVVLMDIGMPGLNGLDTARMIRQQPWGRDILLVAVTGWGQSEDKRQTREAGFDHHLVKPVKASDIEALLAARNNAAVS